ncbi:hypothetical protein EDD18DRAFT_1110528 [Armillaria luteobubalina]|uniref:Uncharacterized protein n=1 Tax=Armillaria luteobubalina TaxID=153913 RepID=A0AA39PPT3_9AGAR|nr:hypothetical protein EDD18DRAFT_1110528 [Armillaria luteobubalina]
MKIYEFFLPDGSISKDCVLPANLSGPVTFPHQVTDILGLTSHEEVPSTKVDKHTSGDGFSDGMQPMKQESIDLAGLDFESDDQNISVSQNNEDAFLSSTTTTSAIDVSHLFDFSSTNFQLGPAYMDEDEDNHDTNRVAIFQSPLRSPQALPQTPTRSERYSLRPRPRPSARNAPSCIKSPPAKCRK